jgi:monomeric isocitrate dehydrogenase
MGSVPNVGLMAQKQKNIVLTIKHSNDCRCGTRCGYKGTVVMEQAVDVETF